MPARVGRGSFSAWTGLVLLSIGWLAGCGSSSKPNGGTATPQFSPGGGSYNTSQTVTVSDTSKGAVLYCTTDGTTPTASSPRCAQPTTVYKTEFLQAIAVAPGESASSVASAGYTIDLTAAATPTFAPAGGTYTSTQSVTIADGTPGANIYYTVDGTVPTASSTLYTGPVTVSATETVSAIAIASGFGNSGVASAVYVINPVAATPVFSVPGGTYSAAQSVGLSDATAGATIYYTLDGSTPTMASMVYSAPVPVTQTATLNAIAVASGYAASAVASASYTITLSPAPTPTFTPTAGAYTSTQTVTISDAASNPTIYYTVDGSVPGISSPVYSAPLTVAATETLQAIAVAPGYATSAVGTAAYTINLNAVATPAFSPAPGTFSTAQTVTISDTAGTTIYYTTDGSTPTTTSMVYSAPISVSATETLKALATLSGSANSAIATATYTINLASASLAGTVLGGTAPVNGAQVQMYAAGQTGYGSNATAIGSPVTTNSTGAFTLPYNCPTSPGDLIYLVATGGNAGSGSNAASSLMAALGPCAQLTSSGSVTVNEVTTVASAYALSPFITAAPNVGSPSTNYQGLTNAFATVANLVNPATGAALTITPAYSTGAVPFLNSSTVPQARINTLADVLAACVTTNGAGAGCSGLFSAATPPAGSAPTTTLQAIVNIAQNPGANATTLFALASPTGPYQPELPAAPNDWTLALTFTGGGLGISPTDAAALGFEVANVGITVDATGNIWVAAYEDNFPGGLGVGDSQLSLMAEFNSAGAPLTPATALTRTDPQSPATGASFGGYTPDSSYTAAINVATFDQLGNLWLGYNLTGDLVEVSAAKQVLLGGSSSPLAEVNSGINLLAIDLSDDVWMGGLFGALAAVHNDGTTLLGSNTFGAATWSNFAFDSAGNLWAADVTPDVYELKADGTFAFNAFPTGGTTATTLAADGAGNIYGCGAAASGQTPVGQTLNVFNAGAVANSYTLASVRGCGNQLLLDGAGRLFAVSNGSAAQAVDVFTTAGVAISPANNGYTGTSSAESTVLNFDPNAGGLSMSSSAAIDGSGNLWVLNADTNGAAAPGNVLVEFVGIAAPVVTPTSVALQNGQLGTRP